MLSQRHMNAENVRADDTSVYGTLCKTRPHNRSASKLLLAADVARVLRAVCTEGCKPTLTGTTVTILSIVTFITRFVGLERS